MGGVFGLRLVARGVPSADKAFVPKTHEYLFVPQVSAVERKVVGASAIGMHVATDDLLRE